MAVAKQHKNVYIYVCGPTVYAAPHIGNMRPILTFDVYVRALRLGGHRVTFIHNVTDIDDKIIAQARQEKILEKDLAERYLGVYNFLLKELNVVKPTHMPKVTDHMDLMIDFVAKLVAGKSAYVSEGSVYFDVKSIEDYGTLAHRQIEELVDEEPAFGKRNIADFALWKKTSEGARFDSPWGKGRPGWHTECAALISFYLKGKSLTVHGGGIDLLFPHHENERAQYKALYGTEIASQWRHVGHLNHDGEKMSKSIGNLIGASEFIAKHGVDTLRYLFLTTSFSAPIDLNAEMILAAEAQVAKYEKTYKRAQLYFNKDRLKSYKPLAVANEITSWNFPLAMKIVNDLVKKFNGQPEAKSAIEVYAAFNLLGFAFTRKHVSKAEKARYANWEKARDEKNYELSDKLRKELQKAGLI